MVSSIFLYTFGDKKFRNADSLGSLIGPQETFAKIFNQESGVWWLHCTAPSQGEILALTEALQVHPLTTEDILQSEVKEKQERFDNYLFVVYGLNEVDKMFIIATKFGVLSIQTGEKEISAVALFERIRSLPLGLYNEVVTPNWVCYAILDSVTDTFSAHVDEVEKEASHIEKELFLRNGESNHKDLLCRMCAARDKSIELMRLFQGKSPVLRSLLTYQEDHNNKQLSDGLLLSAAYGHLEAMCQSTYAMEAILARSFVNYISIMRVKMVHSNASMEQIVGAVALVGLVLLPSHVITSAWAMNCQVPGQTYPGQGWFWGVCSMIIFFLILSCIWAYRYYRRIVQSSRAGRFLDLKHYL